MSALAVRPEDISLFIETQYLSKILTIIFSSSSSSLPTRIWKR
nr:MAG TPA: CysA-like protein [Caudoviricetes sp.]